MDFLVQEDDEASADDFDEDGDLPPPDPDLVAAPSEYPAPL
jgi:hypothetical protein